MYKYININIVSHLKSILSVYCIIVNSVLYYRKKKRKKIGSKNLN